MTIGETAALTGAMTVALACIELAKAAINRKHGKTKDDDCEDCQATVKTLARNGERTERRLEEIRDGVRDLVRLHGKD